jgi:thiol-disulfide isomerase/thioredoxin
VARLVPLLALGCKAGAERAPEPSYDSMATTATTAPAATRRVRMVAAERDGDVAAMVRVAAAEATRAGRRLVVYVGASWCEPCQRFHDAAARGDLDTQFGDVTLLEFDLDRDGERLSAAGYGSQYIPLFALPAPNGTASGEQIEGAIKGEGAVGFVVPRLAKLLAR